MPDSVDAPRFTIEEASNPHGWWVLDYGARREYHHTAAQAALRIEALERLDPPIAFDEGWSRV